MFSYRFIHLGNGTVIVNGQLTILSISATGTTIINNNQIEISSSISTGSAKILNSASGTIILGCGSNINTGVLDNMGIVSVECNTTGNITLGSLFQNSGLLALHSSTLNVNGLSQTAGSINLSGGMLVSVNSINILGGFLTGTGEISTSTITISSQLALSNQLNINGSLIMTPSSTLLIHIGSSYYGSLFASNIQFNNGKMVVEKDSSFVASQNTTYPIATSLGNLSVNLTNLNTLYTVSGQTLYVQVSG